MERFRLSYVEPDGDVDDYTGRWIVTGHSIRVRQYEDGIEVDVVDFPATPDGAREAVAWITGMEN